MVAVKSSDADRFLSSPPTHVILYLVFGTDTGLVSERKRALLRRVVSDPADVFQVVEISGDAVASDPLRLLDEANSVSLFGGKRAISIDAGSKSFIGAVESILKLPPQECTVVISAGALKRDSALRSLIERDRNAVAIECVPDGVREIDDLIQAMATAEGYSVEPEARRRLSRLLGSDRLATRAEINKLLLYSHGNNSITVDDVEAIVADQSSLAIDAAITGAFSGDKAAVDDTASRVFMTGGDANMLLGFVLKHAIALQKACLEIDSGSSVDQAAQGLLRGGPFSRKEAVVRQLRLWTTARLTHTIARIVDAVGLARRDPKLSQISTVRALWAIAHTADPKGR